MKRFCALLCLGGLLAGCTGPDEGHSASTAGHTAITQDTVAIINGQTITMDQLQKPLLEAYGLNVLLNLMQLDVAQQTAARNHVSITEADVQSEMDRTLAQMFKDNNAERLNAIDDAQAKGDKQAVDDLRKAMTADNQQLLDQFLQQQHLSRPEFEIVIRTNTYLRKIVEPTLKDAVTDKLIEDGFNFRYGEKVQVRHIQVTTREQLRAVEKRLKDGEDFGQVAVELSENPRTAPGGGLLPPFSRATPGLSEVFKSNAFDLKEGQVSDEVNTEGSYQLIKCERIIHPKAVKLEDVKESIRHDLYESMVTNSMKQLRAELAQDALKTMKIIEPTLHKQLEDRMFQAQKQVKGKDDTLARLREERELAEHRMSTQPTSQPATPAAHPPATMPASIPTTSVVPK